jgi:hypothetical protein
VSFGRDGRKTGNVQQDDFSPPTPEQAQLLDSQGPLSVADCILLLYFQFQCQSYCRYIMTDAFSMYSGGRVELNAKNWTPWSGL